MGRGSIGATVAPAADATDSDQRLVAAVRAGDDRAFEVLYHRYQRRIHAYVFGMVKDHGRAEDVTQEVFVSALRRMRETEQPLAFKPWLYQIAKNGCIDVFRRAQRAEEVSYDAEDALAPGDHSKLIGAGPSPDAAVAAKQELESLCGAFGGLSDTHHEILVLRELEGLSYAEIGRRLDMSRPAVESTLFRARRRLTEEYGDIVSGARCQRIQGIIVTAAESTLGARDTRRLARHLSHCQSCRREALAAGLDRELFARPSIRERIASLLPFGLFARPLTPSGRWTSQLPLLSDHASSGWGKAAAGVAVLAAGLGAGAGVQQQAGDRESQRPAPVAAKEQPAPPPRVPARPAVPATAASDKATTARDADRAERKPTRTDRKPRARNRAGGSRPRTAAGRSEPSGRGGPAVPATTAADSNPTPAPKRTAPAREKPASAREDKGGDSASKPAPEVPAAGAQDPAGQTQQAVQRTTDTLNGAVQNTTSGVQGATQQVGTGLDETVRQVTGDGPVAETVDGVTNVVDEVVDGVKKTVDGTAGGVGDTLNRLTTPRSRNPGG